jgi:hypothetical protein
VLSVKAIRGSGTIHLGGLWDPVVSKTVRLVRVATGQPDHPELDRDRAAVAEVPLESSRPHRIADLHGSP